MCLAAGCIAPQTVVMSDVDSRGWSDPVTVAFRNDDSLSQRTLSVVLRYNGDFRCTALPLDITVSLPDAGQFTEHVVVHPAHSVSPAAVVSAAESMTYRRSSVLRQRGYYLFTISPAWEVRGVEAVGIDIKNE